MSSAVPKAETILALRKEHLSEGEKSEKSAYSKWETKERGRETAQV